MFSSIYRYLRDTVPFKSPPKQTSLTTIGRQPSSTALNHAISPHVHRKRALLATDNPATYSEFPIITNNHGVRYLQFPCRRPWDPASPAPSWPWPREICKAIYDGVITCQLGRTDSALLFKVPMMRRDLIAFFREEEANFATPAISAPDWDGQAHDQDCSSDRTENGIDTKARDGCDENWVLVSEEPTRCGAQSWTAFPRKVPYF